MKENTGYLAENFAELCLKKANDNRLALQLPPPDYHLPPPETQLSHGFIIVSAVLAVYAA